MHRVNSSILIVEDFCKYFLMILITLSIFINLYKNGCGTVSMAIASTYLNWWFIDRLIYWTTDYIDANWMGSRIELCSFRWIGRHYWQRGSRHVEHLQNWVIIWPWWKAQGVFIYLSMQRKYLNYLELLIFCSIYVI